MEVKDSVVVITGGSSGIGEATGKYLANLGAKVVLADVNTQELDRAVGEIVNSGGQAIGVSCDITNDEQVSKLMDRAIETHGSLNAVLANAGIIRDGLVINTDRETGKVKRVMSSEDFRKVIDINLTGTFITVREAAMRMVDHGFNGVIVMTSSVNKVGQVGQINYASAKAAVAMWPKLLSAEFHMKKIGNIRTAAIAPGYTATAILNNMNQDALKAILKDVHSQRLVEPDEIAKTMAFIMENEAVDGTCIEVTGGITYGPRAMVK